jgi:hypothetical protein
METTTTKDPNRVFSQDADPQFNLGNEAQAMVDHFGGNVPESGGEMGKVLHYLETERTWVHQNDWKTIYEAALKISRNGKKR